jgi:hypothetical protein
MKLKNILIAYSRRNNSIGYVQGMNFIVGNLLKVVKNEEECFWLFVQIIEQILPLNYFSELAGLMVDVDILILLLEKYFPNLIQHLEENCILEYFKNILFQWLITLFSENFKFESTIVIWDMMFLEKSIVLLKTVIGLLKLAKNDLLKIENLDDFKSYFRSKLCVFRPFFIFLIQ